MKVFGLVILLLASVGAIAQTPSTGRVVFYRPKNAVISTRAFDSSPVFIDGKELPVHLKGDEYYQVDLSAGHHVFRASDKRMVVGLDVEAGKTYYLRQGWRYGSNFPRGMFEVVDANSGAEQVKLMHFKDLSKPENQGNLMYPSSH